MSNLVQARVTITDARPLLWHHFGPDAISLEKQEKSSVAGRSGTRANRKHLLSSSASLQPAHIFRPALD